MLVTQFPMEGIYHVHQGDNLTLTCTVWYPDGADKELVVFWIDTLLYFNYSLGSLSTTNSTEMTVTNILQFQNIQQEHSGFYCCLYHFDYFTLYCGNDFELVVEGEYGPHVS